MGELLKAIKALYDAAGGAALRALTTGGIWLSEAPQDSSGVYVVVTPIAGPLEYAMNKGFTQDADVQFTIATLTGSASDISAAMTALEALYDFCSLTITGRRLLVARRINDLGPIRDEVTAGNIGYVEYRFTVGSSS